MVYIYNYKFNYNFKQGEKVTWNTKIFKRCPFAINEIKTVTDVYKNKSVRLNNKIMWWN